MEDLVSSLGKVDPTFWAGRRVFLTGHTGFKGSWLTLWLASMGAKVHGFALAPEGKVNLFDLANVGRDITDIRGDIREADLVREALISADPEILIHMAAQPLVRQSYEDPVATYATNVMGTVHVLEAARYCPSLTAIVSVTTDKCYENREWVWSYREDEAMGGHDPYSSSKGCAELVSAAYRQSFFLARPDGPAVATARAGNVIGGGDWAAERLVPDILDALLAEQPVELRNPLATRPWQHVLEPLSGYLVLAQALACGGDAFAEGWNFGPREEDSRSVQWIVERLSDIWTESRGQSSSWVPAEGFHPHEAQSLKLDISKARARLGWEPKWSIGSTLDRIVTWHKAWLAGGDMRTHCLDEIDAYSSQSIVSEN